MAYFLRSYSTSGAFSEMKLCCSGYYVVSTNQETARCSPPANLGDHGEAPWLNGMSAFHRFAERLGRREIDRSKPG